MELVKEFGARLLDNGIAPKTQESYVGDVKGFLGFLSNQGEIRPDQLTRKLFVDYKNYLINNDFAVTTINKKVNSLQSFNQYLIEEGLISQMFVSLSKDKIKVASGSESSVDVFSDSETVQLLNVAKDRNLCSLRNQLIVNLLLYTGLRVSELSSLRLSSIDLLTFTLKVNGKGGKYREIPLRPDVAKLVMEYLGTERQASGFRESQYLLLSQRAGKLHRDALSTMLEGLGKKLGFKVYPHKFRHTFCSLLLRKGVPLTTVSKLAGHAHVQTTATYYIHTSRQDKIEAVSLL